MGSAAVRRRGRVRRGILGRDAGAGSLSLLPSTRRQLPRRDSRGGPERAEGRLAHRRSARSLRGVVSTGPDCGRAPALFRSPRNQAGLEDYVEQIKGAEGLLIQYPTWCFGSPAMLKGFFDRLLIPGVAFTSNPARPKPSLDNLRKIVGVVTYGQPWSAAFWRAMRRARR